MTLRAERAVSPTDGSVSWTVVDSQTELTSENHRLAADARAAQTENRQLKDRVQALEDDLTASRTSLRRMIRDENRLLPPP
ncbi:hypothetical protein ACF05T_27990 [Streptomyces lateritius]|uniref:Uncharacterized protein n=1 Tax=Streptomyces lateritius TaxID=67313 RepID=A0ABW6YJ85_9ACTN